MVLPNRESLCCSDIIIYQPSPSHSATLLVRAAREEATPVYRNLYGKICSKTACMSANKSSFWFTNSCDYNLSDLNTSFVSTTPMPSFKQLGRMIGVGTY